LLDARQGQTPNYFPPIKRDIKIGRGTHLMHLEAMRYALYRESVTFLLGNDVAAVHSASVNN
jgi:hypothetical protein